MTDPDAGGLRTVQSWKYAFPASVISRLGDAAFNVTMTLWVGAGIARGAAWGPTAITGVMLSATLPTLVVGPLAGVWADRLDPGRVLRWSNWFQAVALVPLLILALSGSAAEEPRFILPVIYATVFVCNAAGQFFQQSRVAMISDTVPDRLRDKAYSYQMSAFSVVAIVGPPVSAPIVSLWGPSVAIGLNVLSFAVSGLLLARVEWARQAQGSSRRENRPGFHQDLREGITVVASHPLLRTILVSLTLVAFGTGAMNTLDVFFVMDVLHSPAAAYGLLAMGLGIGSVVGAAVAPRVSARFGRGRAFFLGVVAMGVAIVAFSFSRSLWQALALNVCIGVPLGVVNAILSPLVLVSVDRQLIGRVISLMSFLPVACGLVASSLSGIAVSTLLAGAHGDVGWLHITPVGSVFCLSGLLIIGAGAVGWRSHRVEAVERRP